MASSIENYAETLKQAVKTLWQMENQQLVSATTLDHEQTKQHLSEARRHLNALLNVADPIAQIVDQPPVIDERSMDGANT